MFRNQTFLTVNQQVFEGVKRDQTIREGNMRSRNKQYPGNTKMDFAQVGSLD